MPFKMSDCLLILLHFCEPRKGRSEVSIVANGNIKIAGVQSVHVAELNVFLLLQFNRALKCEYFTLIWCKLTSIPFHLMFRQRNFYVQQIFALIWLSFFFFVLFVRWSNRCERTRFSIKKFYSQRDFKITAIAIANVQKISKKRSEREQKKKREEEEAAAKNEMIIDTRQLASANE